MTPPGWTTTSPTWTSSPAGRTKAPAATRPVIVTRSPSAATSSWGTTASAPSGSGAPVKIRIASPARSGRDGKVPAMIRPTTASSTGSPRVSRARTAYPSIDEFAQGGISDRETMGSASTRPRAAITSTRSTANGSTRERICPSASSTVNTPLLYYTGSPLGAGHGGAPRDPCSQGRSHAPARRTTINEGWLAWSRGAPPCPAPSGEPREGSVARVRKIEDGLEAGEEPAPAQHEQREEARGDGEVAQAERQPGARRDRREHDEHALEENRDEAEDRHHDERGVSLRRPTGEALEQIRERDQPAHDQHDPGQRRPRLDEDALDEKPRLHRHVAVPDHEILRPEEVHPHDRHGELKLGHVLDRGRRDRGAAAGVGPDREDRQEAERRVERADGEVPAEETAVPLGIQRHHEVESPQRDRHEPQHQENHRDANAVDALALLVLWDRVAQEGAHEGEADGEQHRRAPVRA